MADTKVQLTVEAFIRTNCLQNKFGQPFRKGKMAMAAGGTWAQAKDVSIRDAIDSALTANINARLAQYQQDSAAAALTKNDAAYLPDIAFSASQSRTFRENLSALMTPFDPHYTSTLAATAHSLGASAGAANAPAVAQGLLYAQVQQQGAFLSYIDAFHFMTVICIVVIPLALLLRSPKNTVKADIAIH